MKNRRPLSDKESCYRDKRYKTLVRQSNDAQGSSSTEAQLQWMHDEGDQLGMTLVRDIVLDGVTGSIPGKRQDIEKLFEDKRKYDDFDVLMIQRMDRATRSGTAHGMWFEHECHRHGIELIFPGEDLPDDPHHAVWAKVSKYEAAYEQAKSISQRSTQGWVYALSQSRCLSTSRTPFGCDRLYLSAEGNPLFRIRCLPDGTQQKLDIEGETVIESFGSKSRFRKQKDQKPVIVPGERQAAEAVRDMFDLHYFQGLGGKRIADILNRRGILSSAGKGWSQRQVESLYENPIYCGLALGGKCSQGIFNRRGASGPEKVTVSDIELASRSSPPRKLRPPEEWVWEEQPSMLDFLPSELRDKALPLIKQVHLERWKRSQDPDRPNRSTSKHKSSEYILTGLLVDNQYGEPLTGTLCGKVGKKVRKYRHRRGRLGYIKGSPYNNFIRAPELESAVLTQVFEVIADAPAIRQRIFDAIDSQPSTTETQKKHVDLQSERKQIAEQVQRIAAALTDEDLDDAKPVLDRLRTRRREIDAQIEEISSEISRAALDPAALADTVLARLQDLPAHAHDLDAIVKRDLLQAFVGKIEVDMETKNAEVFLQLPPWAMKSALEGSGEGRLAHSSPSSTSYETHPTPTIRLAWADCRYHHVHGSNRPVCYRCRRKAA